MNLLDRIGSLFVYRSPNALDGYKSHLRSFSNRKLRDLVGTTSHYSKDQLIQMYLQRHLQAATHCVLLRFFLGFTEFNACIAS